MRMLQPQGLVVVVDGRQEDDRTRHLVRLGIAQDAQVPLARRFLLLLVRGGRGLGRRRVGVTLYVGRCGSPWCEVDHVRLAGQSVAGGRKARRGEAKARRGQQRSWDTVVKACGEGGQSHHGVEG